MAKKPYNKKDTVKVTSNQALAMAQRKFAETYYLQAMVLVKEMFGADDDQVEEFVRRLSENIKTEMNRVIAITGTG